MVACLCRGRVGAGPTLPCLEAACPPTDDGRCLDGAPSQTPRSARVCWVQPDSHLVGRAASGDLVVFECPCLGTVETACQTETATTLAYKKTPEAVTQFQT